MNGKLSSFIQTKLDIKPKDEFIKGYTDQGFEREMIEAEYERLIRDEIWVNGEYQVNIDKNPPHNFENLTIWHLSIKRLDKRAIHDWRDLQEIKNILVGIEHEAIEIYPAESRKHDSANQYHLWAFIREKNSDKPPQFPVGWHNRLVSEKPFEGGKQRPFANKAQL